MAIRAGAGYTPEDPFGLYANKSNPFAPPALANAAPAAPQPHPVEAENAAREEQWRQLEAEDPGRYRLIEANTADAWREDWQARQPGFIEDALRQLVGGAYKGTGAAVRGIGSAVAALGDVTTTPVINAIFGTDYRTGNALAVPADWIAGIGEKAQEGVSFATREAIAGSTPDGDLLDPSTWSLGTNPSLEGYVALTLDVFGQMAPVVAAAVATGPAGAALAGGAQGGGAAVEQAHALIDSLAAEPGVLERESAYYRELIAAGRSHEEALALTKDAAGKAAFALTAPISALGGYATGHILNPASTALAGQGIVANILGRAALSGVEEGAQEAAESIATRAGVNVGAGTELDPTEGTFADFLLGALAGGVPGAVSGALSGGRPRETADSEASGEIEAVAGLDAPVPPPGQGPEAPPPPAPVSPAGPLARAMEHGLTQVGQAASAVVERAAGARAVSDAPPTLEPMTLSSQMPGLPSIGQQLIVEPPGEAPFSAKVEQYLTTPEGPEVLVVTGHGEVLQLPVAMVRALNLTDTEIAAMERAENPPLERPAPPPEPRLREVQGAQLRFPDELLARLYDLGREREIIRRNERGAGLALQSHAPQTVEALANELGVPPERINEIADDYRYRAEKTARGAGSGLVQNMHGLNAERLRAWRAERAKADAPETSSDATSGAAPSVPADPDAAWWGGLPPGARRALFAAVQVRRSEKTPWDKISATTRRKLIAARDSVTRAVDGKGASVDGSADTVDGRANAAATSPLNDRPEPSPAQKEAGNYALGHVRLGGLDISIENPAGSERRGTDRGGKDWSVTMADHYGYIRSTRGRDKDHIDVFVRPGTEAVADDAPVFVVDQRNAEGRFDEHKVMVGYDGEAAARKAYLANYSKGWKGLGAITGTTLGEFKRWLAEGDTTQPFAPEVERSAGRDGEAEGRRNRARQALADAEARAEKLAPRTRRDVDGEKGKLSKGRSGRIEDFGERLEGARKHLVQEYRRALDAEIDLAVEPLSKSFPQPDYSQLARDGVPVEALAIVALLRDSIPHRPRMAHKLRRWVAHTNKMRQIASRLLAGGMTAGEMHAEMEAGGDSQLASLAYTSRAIAGVTPERLPEAAKWRVGAGSYSVFAGQRYSPPRTIYHVIDPDGRLVAARSGTDAARAYDTTLDGAVEKARALVEAAMAAPTDRKVGERSRRAPVAVYRDPRSQELFIGFKVRSTVLRLKGGFAEAREARAYIEENGDELHAKIEEMRRGPAMRREENAPRAGRDWRPGDVTPEHFAEAFGFRGVQFGNYVEGPRRQSDLNQAFDALMDLADALNLPPRALSLDGQLGLAFGARGRGGKNAAAAHFEPDRVVINLTKGSGPGSLAHEWLHALDNYFARQDGATGYMTERRREEGTVREEVRRAWLGAVSSVATGPFHARAATFDRARSKVYWSQPIELMARAFERYIVDRLAETGIVNDYLANIDLEGGAYPTPAEMRAGMREAFDGLFSTIEAAPGEGGRVRLHSRREGDGPVAVLTGAELVDFRGPEDMPALRRAAQEWYRTNLLDAEVTTAAGEPVRFSGRGLKKSTYGGKGDVLLRAVPAIRAIIENGAVVMREAGDRQGVSERMVIAAPVEIAGTVHSLAVSLHRMEQGLWHYDLHRDTGARSPGVGVPGDPAAKPSRKSAVEGASGSPNLVEQQGQGKSGRMGTESPGVGVPGGNANRQGGSLDQPALETTLGGLNLFEWTGADNAQGGERVDALRAELAAGTLGEAAARLEREGRLTIGTAGALAAEPGVQAWTDPDGSITLVADAIPEGEAEAVLLHEAFHAGARPLLGEKAWRETMLRLAGLYRQFEASRGAARTFFERARDRVRQAEAQDGAYPEALKVEEFAAYAIEEYAAAPRALRLWVDDLLGAIKAWALRRFGRQIGALTPAQLRALARAAISAEGGAGAAQAASRRRSIAGGGRDAGAATPSWPGHLTAAELARQIKGKLKDFQPHLLALVPLNYFTELAPEAMAAPVKDYLSVKRRMDAWRDHKHAAMNALGQEWRKYAALGFGAQGKRGRLRAAELSDLMHDATIAGVDPSLADEATRALPGYEALRARYMAMPRRGRELFAKVRDAYRAQADEVDAILLENVRKVQEIAMRRVEEQYRKALADIAAAGLEGEERKKAEHAAESAYEVEMRRARAAMKGRMTRMRIAFESSRAPAPYFPLARFGRYFVTVKTQETVIGEDGEPKVVDKLISFSRREREADRDALAREMEKAYPKSGGFIVETGVLEEKTKLKGHMDPKILGEIDRILGDAAVDEKVRDAIYQRYLTTLPDLSTRKRFIHRKGTAGYAGDALRVFANHMFHAAHQTARLKYQHELSDQIDRIREQAKEADRAGAEGDAMTLANELGQRHDWVMNPVSGSAAQVVNSAMFVWHLAASPAAALVNMTQTPMLGIPILGARLGGMGKAAAAIGKASADFVRGKGAALGSAGLAADERRALEAAYESGLIERSQSHDLAGVGETGVEYSPVRQAVMEKISWMYHQAEVVNREVTYLAAYRLARASGQTEAEAVDTAHDLSWKTHFDYSNSSRARVLQKDAAKVVFVFQSHSLNIWYRIFRDIHQSFAGASPAVRKEARTQLAGILGMQALMGGITGFFGWNVVMGVAGLFGLFGDDDDPRDPESRLRGAVIDLFGTEIGGMILKGVPGHLAGIDLSSRVGMMDFFLRMPDSGKEGRDYAMELLVALTGASGSTFVSMFDGFSLIGNGKVLQGVGAVGPKFVRDMLSAARWGGEGLRTRGGDIILERADMDWLDYLRKFIGFQPARVAEAYERNAMLYDASNRVQTERRDLMRRFTDAVLANDPAARTAAIEAIIAWNRKGYARAMPITDEALRQSLGARLRNQAKREDGVLIQNEALGTYLRMLLPERVY